MTVNKILDYCMPLTSDIAHCKFKKQRWELKREVLRKMIEAYKNGEIVDFEPMKLSVDLDELFKKMEN